MNENIIKEKLEHLIIDACSGIVVEYLLSVVELRLIHHPASYELGVNSYLNAISNIRVSHENLYTLIENALNESPIEGYTPSFENVISRVTDDLMSCGITSGISSYLYSQPLNFQFVSDSRIEVDIRAASRCCEFPEWFLAQNIANIDLSLYIMHNKVSESFLHTYSAVVNWYWVSVKQTLSESFIEEHSSLVDWDAISLYQNLSDEFIDKYSDRLNNAFINERRGKCLQD